jgi:hypothetical protein
MAGIILQAGLDTVGRPALSLQMADRQAFSVEEALMYSYVKHVGIPAFLVREAPAFAVAFVIAELFYKFRSFSLECLAFLATWYVLSWLQSAVLGRRGE